MPPLAGWRPPRRPWCNAATAARNREPAGGVTLRMNNHARPTPRYPFALASGAVLALVLVGCSGVAPASPSADAATGAPRRASLPARCQPWLRVSAQGVPPAVIDAAVADAAARAGVSLAEVTVVSAASVTFPEAASAARARDDVHAGPHAGVPGGRGGGWPRVRLPGRRQGRRIRWCENPPSG